jgi:putative zinc finger/helix-turn-helix YgiT family protein
MPRPYPWKCRSCGEKCLSPVTIDYPVTMEHDGRSFKFTVVNLQVLKCAACQEEALPDESMKRIYDQLRVEAGLLSPTEIREKRKQLELTQEDLASQLGVAKETISRWETGGQIQQRGYDKLLRVYFDVQAARDYLAPTLSNTPKPEVAANRSVDGGNQVLKSSRNAINAVVRMIVSPPACEYPFVSGVRGDSKMIEAGV